jgi:hypothetical protein
VLKSVGRLFGLLGVLADLLLRVDVFEEEIAIEQLIRARFATPPDGKRPEDQHQR